MLSLEMFIIPVLLCLLVQMIPWIEGSGKIVTRFVKFENLEGKKFDGSCCDPYWSWGRTGDCQSGDMCDPAFIICLGNITQSSSLESCEYGRRDTGVLSDDSNAITFADKLGKVDNPLVFNFNEWPGVVKLKILATDADSDRFEIMDTFTYMHNQKEVVREIDATPNTLQLFGSRSNLDLELRVFCDLNFYGKNCDTYCAPPTDGTAKFMCDPLTGERICLAGYEGSDCRTNKDDCEGNPCYKGATCKDGIDSFTCVCPVGRTGTRCEEEINECLSDPCQHGGTCRDAQGFYYCECPVGTLGYNCEIDISECESDPCQNNASCVDQVNAFQCICQVGYDGETCETEIDECAAEPCMQATGCTDHIGDYTCECVKGFTGKNCDVDIDECENKPCQNNGLCVNMVNNYSCICRDGTTGKFCEVNFDECESGPCQNGGSCVDHINAYTCDCASPYTGDMCETKMTPCQDLPCKNGATCSDAGDTFKCRCHQGFTGSVCEVNINECESNPCVRGHCMDLTGRYGCRCPPMYTGLNCETLMPSTIPTTFKSTTAEITSTVDPYPEQKPDGPVEPIVPIDDPTTVDPYPEQKPDGPVETIVPIDDLTTVDIALSDMTVTADYPTTDADGNTTDTVSQDLSDTSTVADMDTTYVTDVSDQDNATENLQTTESVSQDLSDTSTVADMDTTYVTDVSDQDNATENLQTTESVDDTTDDFDNTTDILYSDTTTDDVYDDTTDDFDNTTDILYSDTTTDDVYIDDDNITSLEMTTTDFVNVSREDDMETRTDEYIDLDGTTDTVTEGTASYEDSSEIDSVDSVTDDGSGELFDTTLESATSDMDVLSVSATPSQQQTPTEPPLVPSPQTTLSSEEDGSGETTDFDLAEMTSTPKTQEIQSTAITSTDIPFTAVPVTAPTVVAPEMFPPGSDTPESSGEVGSGDDTGELTPTPFTDRLSSSSATTSLPDFTEELFDSTMGEADYLPVSSPQTLPLDPIEDHTQDVDSVETEVSGEVLPTSDSSVTIEDLGSGDEDDNTTTQAIFTMSSLSAIFTMSSLPASVTVPVDDMTTSVPRPIIDPGDFNIEESVFEPAKTGTTLPLVTFPDRNRWTPPKYKPITTQQKYVPPTKKQGTTDSINVESTTLSEDFESAATWLYDSLSTLSGFTGSPKSTTEEEAGPPPPILLKTTTVQRGDIPPEPDSTTLFTRRTLPPKPTRPPRQTTTDRFTAPVRTIPSPTQGIKLPITDNSGKDKDTTVVIKPSLGFVSIRTTVYHNVKKAYNVGKKIADAAYKKAKGILRRTHRRLRDLWDMCKRGALRMVYAPYNTARNVYTTVINRGRQGIANMVQYARSRVKKYYSYLKNYYKKSYNYYYTQYYNYFKNKWANYWG